MIFRQLFDPQSSTYSYLLADAATRDAVLIDPVFEQVRRDVALLSELDLKLNYTLETHVHADHVTGAWLLRQRTGSESTEKSISLTNDLPKGFRRLRIVNLWPLKAMCDLKEM